MSRKNSIILAAVVFMVMGVVMAVSAFGFQLYYGNPELLRIAIFGEVLTAVFIVFWIRRKGSFASVGFSTLKVRGLVWLVPIFLVVLYQFGMIVTEFISRFNQLSGSTIQLLIIIFVTTLFVGFNEEVTFRGVLLRMLKPDVHPYRAIVISALLFSSFHLLNLIAFIPPGAMLFQLGNTFLFGLFFALVALKLNNLWPLIIFHALWDFSSIAGDVLAVNLTIPTLITQVFVIVAIVVQLVLLKRHDLSHLKPPSLTSAKI